MGGESKVFISERAYAEMINETLQNIRTETGGILLGARTDRAWFVIESLDPGPRAILRRAYFEYDDKYLTHLANKVRLRYRSKLSLLGLWHRHPGSLDRFSSTDDETNRTFVQTCGGAALSGLINIDPEFRMTFYVASGNPFKYERISCDFGDRHIPAELLQTWDSRGLLNTLHEAVVSVQTRPLDSPLHHYKTQRAVRPDDTPGWLSKIMWPWKRRNDVSQHNATSPVKVGCAQDREREPLILQILDEELIYLDEQHDYSYKLSMENGEVSLLLTRAVDIRECPSRLDFLFTSINGLFYVSWNNQRYPYRPGITRQLITRASERPQLERSE